eukprot:c45855_g1_i1 orf=86-271(+)
MLTMFSRSIMTSSEWKTCNRRHLSSSSLAYSLEWILVFSTLIKMLECLDLPVLIVFILASV